MDWYLVSVLVFAALLAVWVYRDRKKFERDSIFLLRRTKHGRAALTWLGTRFPRFWLVVGFFSVLTGFVVSVLGTKMLFDYLMAAIAAGSSVPNLALLLPSPTSETVFGFGYLAVPFWDWIICIALLALVHEGFHGIFTARERTRIKSIGFGLLAVIPLAFVEPDEKQLEKKGVWPQLRVFSAGSFANFLLGALSMVLMIMIATTAYAPAGVDFQTYPSTTVNVSSIQAVGGHSVTGADDIVSVLQDFGENDTLSITTQNETYYLKRAYIERQFGSGASSNLVVFLDYPAARVGIEGTIVAVDGVKTDDPKDLSLALETVGPGSSAAITVRSNGHDETFQVGTVPVPESMEPGPFTPDSGLYFFAALEHVIPGSIDFYLASGDWLMGLSGQDATGTWSYLQKRMMLWEWVSGAYPELAGTADRRMMAIESELSGRGEPGFIGILGVTPHYAIPDGLAAYTPVIGFLMGNEGSLGLLFFMVIINFGVGLVNLLPLKPLDGGKMWDIVLRRYIPKHAGTIMKVLGYLILALIIGNFIPFGMFY